MRFILAKNQLSGPCHNLLRRAGYTFFVDRHTGHESFARVLGRNGYPRWHIYVYERDDEVEFNLHLDQTKSVYAGQTAHGGDYEGAEVEAEVQRIKSLIVTAVIIPTTVGDHQTVVGGQPRFVGDLPLLVAKPKSVWQSLRKFFSL